MKNLVCNEIAIGSLFKYKIIVDEMIDSAMIDTLTLKLSDSPLSWTKSTTQNILYFIEQNRCLQTVCSNIRYLHLTLQSIHLLWVLIQS